MNYFKQSLESIKACQVLEERLLEYGKISLESDNTILVWKKLTGDGYLVNQDKKINVDTCVIERLNDYWIRVTDGDIGITFRFRPAIGSEKFVNIINQMKNKETVEI